MNKCKYTNLQFKNCQNLLFWDLISRLSRERRLISKIQKIYVLELALTFPTVPHTCQILPFSFSCFMVLAINTVPVVADAFTHDQSISQMKYRLLLAPYCSFVFSLISILSFFFIFLILSGHSTVTVHCLNPFVTQRHTY